MSVLLARPLVASEEDEALYVTRDGVDDALVRAARGGVNTLLIADRGAGVTSLMRRAESRLDDAVYLNTLGVEDPVDLLASLAVRLGAANNIFDAFRAVLDRDPLAPPPALTRLKEFLREGSRTPVALVDGPLDPQVAYQLFGRWRDEIYGLGVTWVLAAPRDRFGEYLRPPADAFFEHRIELRPFTVDEAREALARRGAALPEKVLAGAVRTPRQVIRMARERELSPSSPEIAQRYGAAVEDLSRGAQMLLAELQSRGPVTAGDRELAQRLGMPEHQLRRRLRELELRDLVQASRGQSTGGGRPPRVFTLTELGRYAGGAA